MMAFLFAAKKRRKNKNEQPPLPSITSPQTVLKKKSIVWVFRMLKVSCLDIAEGYQFSAAFREYYR